MSSWQRLNVSLSDLNATKAEGETLDRADLILLTLVIYKIALISIGFLARGRIKNGGDFFLGGRRLGPTVAAISASASSSSSWTLLGASGFAFAKGLSAVWLIPTCIGGFLLNWFIVAPRLRSDPQSHSAVTLSDYLVAPCEGQGRGLLRGFAAMVIVVTFTVYVAAQMKAAGLAFVEVVGYDFETSIILGATVVLAYTLLGGFWAVSLTDTLQGMVMALTAVLLPVALLFHLELGEFMTGLRSVQDATVDGVPGYANLFGAWEGPAAFGFVVGLLGIGLGYPGQPHVVNRFLALEEGEAALKKARRIALLWAVVVYCGMIFLGLAGRLYFTELAPSFDHEQLIFHAADRLLPAALAGIVIAAVLSAVMSTADSQLLVAASAITHDLRKTKGERDPRRVLMLSRLVIVLVVVASACLAIYQDESIFKRVIFAWSAVGASFAPLLLARLAGKTPAASTALCAMMLGFLAVVFHVQIHRLSGLDAAWVGLFKNVIPYLAPLPILWFGPSNQDS